MKQFCNTHKFYFEDKCPFCDQDRIFGLSKRYSKNIEECMVDNTVVTDEEPTTEELQMLVAKFNKKGAV